MATKEVMELIREWEEARFLAACEASRELEWVFFEEEEGRLMDVVDCVDVVDVVAWDV